MNDRVRTPPILKERIERILPALQQLVVYHHTKPAHWIYGADLGEEYCRRCALAEIHRLRAEGKRGIRLDGGFVSDYDFPPFCATCGHSLEGNLTERGVQQEIEAFVSAYLTNEVIDALTAYKLDQVLRDVVGGCVRGDQMKQIADVCAWVERVLERGGLASPPNRGRCWTRWRCRRRRSVIGRTTCSRPRRRQAGGVSAAEDLGQRCRGR